MTDTEQQAGGKMRREVCRRCGTVYFPDEPDAWARWKGPSYDEIVAAGCGQQHDLHPEA